MGLLVWVIAGVELGDEEIFNELLGGSSEGERRSCEVNYCGCKLIRRARGDVRRIWKIVIDACVLRRNAGWNVRCVLLAKKCYSFGRSASLRIFFSCFR